MNNILPSGLTGVKNMALATALSLGLSGNVSAEVKHIIHPHEHSTNVAKQSHNHLKETIHKKNMGIHVLEGQSIANDLPITKSKLILLMMGPCGAYASASPQADYSDYESTVFDIKALQKILNKDIRGRQQDLKLSLLKEDGYFTKEDLKAIQALEYSCG